MKEKEYIELQNLLVKLRVEQLKELDNKDLKKRDRIVRNIRAIDILRKNVEVKL